MPAARVDAQAKINLALRVLARETTGYHQIETLFCRLALGDVVTVWMTTGARSVRCTGARLPVAGLGPAEENLAWRAAAEYARHAHWPGGFAIEIEKRIPVGGGLGGGSADAGAVLRALNALSPSPLSLTALLHVAASLGADVPFLTQDTAVLALGWGRGERLLALPPLPRRGCLLLCPETAVATRDAYAWLDEYAPPRAPALMDVAALNRWDTIARVAHNDFEDVVGERVPAVAAALAALRTPEARALVGEDAIVHMSGSGSTVFAIHADHAEPPVWRSDEPGVSVIRTTTAESVAPVELLD
jgi:4-diphosphocytidyl-2-C-methyl-D-erythritol kinase